MRSDNVLLANVCDIENGFAFKSVDFKEDGVPLLRISNINNEKVFFNNGTVHLDRDNLKKHEKYIVQKGDVVIALSGATTGKYGIYLKDTPCLLNQRIGLIRNNNSTNLDSKYFYFYLSILKSEILRKAQGAAQPNISTKEIGQFKIPLPPLAEQQKIAEILDAADALRQKDQQLIDHYTTLSQSLFLEMFGEPVTNPRGWGEIKMGELANISSGSTPSREVDEYYQGNIPWVKTGEVNYTEITKTSECISEKAIKDSSCRLYPVGSLIIAMYGQGKTRGKVGKLGIKAATNQACAVIPPSNKMNYDYLLALLKLSYEDLRQLGRGGNQPNLNGGLIKRYCVIAPPITLQNQFAKHITSIEKQKQQAQASLTQSNHLFNSLLQKAFTGELSR